tara:strand:+ start:188783 stop:190105 length:1323 start_codon:yes stop_codon:yes gene_type:complete
MFPEFSQNQKDLKPGRYDVSTKLFGRAQTLIPGGVNSPVRAFKGVGGTPVFMAGGVGAVIQDMDENQYIDYVLSWGPMIHGHANKHVIESIIETAKLGTSFGAPTDKETYLADIIQSRHEHVDMVRLVNSGTEATMSAIRLARGYTGKDRIVKCEGCYHGHADSLLVNAGSGLATQGVSSSAGVPAAVAELTTVIPFNNLVAVRDCFEKNNDIACIILEPIAGNMGCIPPKDGYLEGVRNLCDKHGILLIIDEVMTGCRVHYGSAQTLYNVRPDISTFGKVIGGGMPLAAYAGKKEIMMRLAPEGDVYQAGTLSGNPLAVAAGCATLEQLPMSAYKTLDDLTQELVHDISGILKSHKIEHSTTRVGSMFSVFFSKEAPENFADVKNSDIKRFNKFFHALLEEGVYIAPSAFETCFTSLTHADPLMKKLTLDAVEKAAKKI